MRALRDLNPTAVASSRSGTFDAELAFNGRHYVIATGVETRVDAMKLANAQAAAMRKRLVEVGLDFINSPTRKWKETKA